MAAVAYRRWSFTRGPTVRLWLEKFCCLVLAVAYERWSHMEVRLYCEKMIANTMILQTVVTNESNNRHNRSFHNLHFGSQPQNFPELLYNLWPFYWSPTLCYHLQISVVLLVSGLLTVDTHMIKKLPRQQPAHAEEVTRWRFPTEGRRDSSE